MVKIFNFNKGAINIKLHATVTHLHVWGILMSNYKRDTNVDIYT
jgi:hypothetical protein